MVKKKICSYFDTLWIIALDACSNWLVAAITVATSTPNAKSSVGKMKSSATRILLVLAICLDKEAFSFVSQSSSLQQQARVRCIDNKISSIALHAQRLDKGFNLLELASGIVPQGTIVRTAKEGWKFAWQRMMAELAPQDEQGNYQRPSYNFQGRIGDAEFPDEPGRYHLYVGNPCPWCHRTLLTAYLLGITTDELGITRLEDNPTKASRGGWVFSNLQPDPVLGSHDLRELYDGLVPGGKFTGRCTAPLLVDKKKRRIVSNESADIVRMLNQAYFGKKNSFGSRLNLYPNHLAAKIDETNEWVYRLLNNGVYRCGFSTTQLAYDKAAADVRQGLVRCEEMIRDSGAYLCGSELTEADVRLLPTILRFDGAYAPLFRAGGAHLRIRCDYPHIYRWLQTCWNEFPAVRQSIDISDACASYYRQLFPLNPGGIIPAPVTANALGLEE